MKQQKPKYQQKNNIGNSENVIPSESSKKNIFYIFIISAIVALLYFPDLNYKFTNDDDTALIKDNYSFLSNPKNAITIFKQSVFYTNFKVKDNYYRPILMLSFFMDTQIAGKHYWFFFLVNILLHLACCILLFLLLQKLIYDKVRSFFFTLIFAVHPVFAQAIAWLPGRNDTLLTLFSLLSFHFLIDYLNRKKILYLILHLFFFIIALLTKESVVFLPLIFLMYAVLIHNDSKNISIKKALNNFKIYIIVWAFLIIAFLILRRATLGQSVAFPLMYVITNFIYNLPALIQFIGKILLPFYLNTLPVMADIPIYYGLIAIVAIIFFIWKTKSKNYKRIIFGSLWLLVFLFPAILRTSDNIETLFLEHRLYFPMIGFIIVCLEMDIIKKINFHQAKTQIIFSLIVAFLFALAWTHREDYKDEFHFWKSAVDGSPHSSAARRGLGTYYVVNNEPEKAEKEFIECLKINPDIVETSNNLGRIYLNRGQDSIAEKLFEHEIDINPSSGMALYNLGCVKYDARKFPEAIELIRKSLKLTPENIDAENDLSAILAIQGQYEESTTLCISVLEKNPKYENARNNLKKIFLIWKDKEKVKYYQYLIQKKGIYLQ